MQIIDQRSTKITETHLQKTAYVYLRQSSMGQVRNHRESTERQYALQELARDFGWPAARIVVLDRDLGKSGTSTTGELRFPLPVGDVFDELNCLVKDPDAQVRSSIELVFDYFQQCGSAYGVVQRFARENLDFPKRS